MDFGLIGKRHTKRVQPNVSFGHELRLPAETLKDERDKKMSMRKIGSKTFLFPVMAAALLTVGCATREDVEHAQATANTALSTAQQAGQAAQQAAQAAQQAQQTADQARSEVSALSQKVDALAAAHAARGPRD